MPTGKDITHKMYSLNEQMSQKCATEALSRVSGDDHWRHSLNRSVSVDVVDTSIQGQVRSDAWKQAEKCHRSLTYTQLE